MSIQDLTQDLARAMGFSETKGALVNNILSGQPADAAGINAGTSSWPSTESPSRMSGRFSGQ